MSFTPHSSSFRDPAGYVFVKDGLYKRAVTSAGRSNYTHLMQSGLYDELVGSEWILPHAEEGEEFGPGEEPCTVLFPRQLDYISYPYEWCFDQLKDAALLTLRIEAAALQHGMSLKDASAFNVQFCGPRPVFIDTLSFEVNRESTWPAYRQFCEHFLAPLLLMSRVSPDWNRLLRASLDGIPLRLASGSLPLSTYWRAGSLLHIHLHARMFGDDSAVTSGLLSSAERRRAKDRKPAILESLTAAVEALHLRQRESRWSRYYANAGHYPAAAEECKGRSVADAVSLLGPRRVLDLGGNNGMYSRVATARGVRSVCLDFDPLCVNENYLNSKRTGDDRMLPLLMDITNPSPALGFDSSERMSLLERPRPDLVLALAVVHHLRIQGCIPFRRLAEFLVKLSPWLLIEYVPRGDRMVVELLRHREDCFDDYSPEGFLGAFARHCEIAWSRDVPGTGRSLYLFRRRP